MALANAHGPGAGPGRGTTSPESCRIIPAAQASARCWSNLMRATPAWPAAFPSVTRRLITGFAARTRPAPAVPGAAELTDREREIVALIAEGLSSEEMARKIYISHSTVNTYASRAMTKLGARDWAQLVVLPAQAGLAGL
jgi:DNA-binding NarL/FixJ family response regulator